MHERARLWPLGIRAQTTLIAVAVVGVSAVLVMVGLILTARASLKNEIRFTAEARAQDIALIAKRGPLPDPLPGLGEDLLVQVLDRSGTVVASSGSIKGQPALVSVRLDPGASRTFGVASLDESRADAASGEGGADPGEPFLIASVGVLASDGTSATVLVAASLNPVQQLVDVLTPRLLIGLPILMMVVGLTVWILTGWALRPVEAIRSQAEAISASSLEYRVPVPRARDEIGMLAATMNRMLDRLEASASAQRRFISDASHELKSPVASIHMMLDVAGQNPSEDISALLEDLAAEDARLEQLLADMLTLARFDENPPPPNPTDVDLDDVAFREARSAARSPGLKFDVTGIHPVRLSAEKSSIESLVRNLVENAARHARSTVWIAVQTEGSEAVLTVSDDGPGIAPEDRDRVFERFVRLDQSRTREDGGTGLGLAVCRALARSMHGEVRVVEPLRAGATFEVRLPLA
jgi:signal transduction histidine kinase